MKIGHISDTHIRLLKDHDSYKKVFEQIYNTLKEEKVDAVVHTGDLFHTKIQLTPEAISMASNFLRALADIAPLYIIPGNHDVNLKNNNRLDSISPIVAALAHKNIYYLKASGETDIGNGFVLSAMSLMDQANWKKPTDPTKVNIALFHGSVAGVFTDIGYVMQEGEFTVDIFDGFDYALCGDIHKANQLLDYDGRCRYAGSTVQQNFGETDDKGFLIWDIKDKDSFTCKQIIIPNPRPYVTILLDENGKLPEIEVKSDARVRIIADRNITVEKVKKAIEIVKTKYHPESVVFVNKANVLKSTVSEINSISHSDNLRDLAVQERLIRDYLKDFKAEEEIMKKVFELNKRLSTAIEEGEEINRGVRWSLKSLEWDNLFNYGTGNKVNFEDLTGVVGIFGKNYSGKSSIIDGLTYTMFNTTSKNNRKNLNVINQTRDNGRGKVVININDVPYIIERKSEKYIKKVKGVETQEAKTDVEFTSADGSLNGLARNDTDKNIRRFLGSVDDFFLTSMATQFGFLSFITEGSTKRKEILARFLDLENFEKKFKLAKEESAELKSLLKKMEGTDYKKDISDAEIELVNLEASLAEKKDRVEALKKKLVDANDALCELQKCISNIPEELINYEETSRRLTSANKQKESLLQENDKLSVDISSLVESEGKISLFLEGIKEEELILKEKELQSLSQRVSSLMKSSAVAASILRAAETKIELLSQVPCGDKYPTCKFISDAFTAKQNYEGLKINVETAGISLSQANDRHAALSGVVNDGMKKLSELKIQKREIETLIASKKLKQEQNKNSLTSCEREIIELSEKLKKYNDNREAIENYEKLLQNREDAKLNVKKNTELLGVAEHEVVDLYRTQGSITAKIEIYHKQMAELDGLRKQFSAYDLFLSCMHPSGISYEIIKSKLPIINQEIAKILTNIVEFSIYLENDDDKLDIMIKHPNFDARPLEMGSGAEKTLASTAIRLALLNVTTLPTGNIFVLDEPGTALDADNLEGFIRIIDLIKGYFKTVILISHLDSLKDCVDTQIIIEKKNGYAYVNT